MSLIEYNIDNLLFWRFTLKKSIGLEDIIAQFILITLAMTMGFTVMGQLTTFTPLIWGYGVLSAIIISTKRNTWKFIDLLFLRRVVIILGFVTTLAVVITGAVTLGVYTNIPLGVYIALGRGTAPVQITMFATLLLLGIWQFSTNSNNK